MARDFAGTTHRIDWANVFNTVSPLTISCWVYPDAIANISYLFASHNAANNAYAELFGFGYSSATAVTLFFEGNGSTSVQRWTTTFNPTTVTGAWHHALLTWDGGTAGANAHIYLDGTERTYAGTINGVTLTAGSGVWSVGNRYYSDNRNLDGRIGYIGVWNTALGTAEIAGLASGKSPDFYSTNLQFWSLDGDNYSNNISGAAGTLDGTTFIADPPIIRQSTAAQANQAQVSDAAPVTFNAPTADLSVAQNNQAQVSDAVTLGVYTPIAPSQQNQAQKSDLATLGVITPITAAQNNQAQVSDIATFGVTIPLTAAQNNQAQVSDAALPTISNPYIVDDIVLEWVAVTQTVTTSQQNQAQVSDAVNVTAQAPTYNVTPAQNNQAQVSDVATLGVRTPITPAQNNQAQVSDAATISSVIHLLSAAENNQAQVSDAATITSGEVAISAADNRQAQVSDAVTVSAYYPITPADCNQSQTSDACILGVIYPITVTDNNQAQVSDAASVTFSGGGAETNITGADNNQAQVMDVASLTVIYILAALENHQAQKSDIASVSIGGVIEHGERRLHEFATRPTHAFATRENLEVDD